MRLLAAGGASAWRRKEQLRGGDGRPAGGSAMQRAPGPDAPRLAGTAAQSAPVSEHDWASGGAVCRVFTHSVGMAWHIRMRPSGCGDARLSGQTGGGAGPGPRGGRCQAKRACAWRIRRGASMALTGGCYGGSIQVSNRRAGARHTNGRTGPAVACVSGPTQTRSGGAPSRRERVPGGGGERAEQDGMSERIMGSYTPGGKQAAILERAWGYVHLRMS